MSAPTATGSAKLEPLSFWERFRKQLESRIREGNTICGELLWRITASTGTAFGLSIQHVQRPADRVDCAFDPAGCLLTCTPGPEIPLQACQFQWIGGTTDILRRGREEYTISEALTLLLDELVWPDE
jgi:hypothetical protein